MKSSDTPNRLNVTVIVARVVRADQIGEDTLTDEAERALYDDTMKEPSTLRASQ